MLKQFRSDKYFFLKYYLINLAFYSVACTLLIIAKNPFSGDFGWLWLLLLVPIVLPDFFVIVVGGLLSVSCFLYLETFHWWYLWGLPLGAYLGVQSGTLMHNASHGNLRPKWINRICGELCGLHQLPGVLGWWVTHKIHHQYPDDPKNDPHPPLALSFWGFVRNMKGTMRTVMTNNYFDQWGENTETKRIWAMVDLTLPLNRFLRALFLFLLFGPALFVFLWIPSYLVNVLFYAHLNYATHRINNRGDFEVLDLDHNRFYRFMNLVGQGCYYHKTHHWRPTTINPQSLKPTRATPLVSYRRKDASVEKEQNA